MKYLMLQSLKCHSKVTSDFVFVGSSSLIATAGHSSDNRNVCLWDTLLPQRRALVQGGYCLYLIAGHYCNMGLTLVFTSA